MFQSAKRCFAKKALFLLVLCILLLFSSASKVFAATDNQTGGVNLPLVTAENLHVSESLVAGSSCAFSFTLNNTENRGSFDIGYRVYLVDKKGTVYSQKDFSRLYVLLPFEKVEIRSSVDLPKLLPSGDYFFKVNAIAPDGEDLGQVEKTVKVQGSNDNFVEFSNASISSGEQKSQFANGIAINPGDLVNIHLEINSKGQADFSQKYLIFTDSNFSQSQVYDGGQVSLKAGVNKVDLSVKSLDSGGNFIMAYWLTDSKGNQDSPIQYFGWGTWGVAGGLKYITIDKQIAQAGDSVDVEVSLDPINLKESAGNIKVKVWVDASYNEGVVDFSKTTTSLVNVKLKDNINKPQIRVSEEKDGKNILDYRTSNQKIKKANTPQNYLPQRIRIQFSGAVLGLILLAIVLTVFLIVRRKYGIRFSVLLLFGLIYMFFAKQDSFASVTSSSSYTTVPSVNTCSPASSYFYIQNLFIYKNGSTTASAQGDLFRPGDTIRVTGNTNPGSGSCTYFSPGSATVKLGGTTIGGGGYSWDVTYVIPSTFDVSTNKNTSVSVTVTSGIRSSGTAGAVLLNRSMTLTMGPQALDSTSLSVSLPSCGNPNYNATFSFMGRNLADNYDINWSTDSTFATGVTTVTVVSIGAATTTYTTTTSPFVATSTYYWRVWAYNSNAGSRVLTTPTTSFFGPIATCLPDLVIRNSTDGTSPPVSVSVPAAISGNTITVQASSSFTISFNTRNIGNTSAGASSCTVMEAFSSTLVGPANVCTATTTGGKQWFPVTNLGPNTSLGSSVTFSYSTAGTYSILIRADAGGVITESSEANNDVNLIVNVTAPPQYDLSASFISTPSVQSFDVGTTINFTVRITNNSSTASVPQTLLYVFPDGSTGLPQCATGGPGNTTAPTDSAGTSLSYVVSPSTSPIGALGSQDITVSFKVSTTPVTSRVAYAYVIPSCSLSIGVDPSYANNRSSGFTYSVTQNSFIESDGGDVGASGANGINVSFDSSTITPTPIYQSDYVLVAKTLGSNANSKKNWELKNYTANVAPSGGVYNYMIGKFLSQAQLNPTCGNFNKPSISYCNGNFAYDSTKTAPTVDQVVFVDGDLTISQNLILASNVALVFVVRGQIIVNLSVTEIDGVFISQEGFTDSDQTATNSGLNSNDYFLTVKGAVYTDAIGGSLSLKRFFTGPYNNTIPADKFIFDPKYLVKPGLVSIIGVKSIKWSEINP